MFDDEALGNDHPHVDGSAGEFDQLAVHSISVSHHVNLAATAVSYQRKHITLNERKEYEQ